MGGYDRRLVHAAVGLHGRQETGEAPVAVKQQPPSMFEQAEGRSGIAVVDSRRFVRECVCRGMADAIPLDFHGFSTLDALEGHDASYFRLVLLSWPGPDANAREDNLSTLKRLQAAQPDAVVVVLSGAQDTEMARLAIAGGARGYIPMTLGL